MSDPRRQIAELLSRAEDLGRGPAQVALIEQAAQVADAHNDPEAAFIARDQLIEAATFSGRIDVALVAFSWCLSQCDQNPEDYDSEQMLWKYKWVIENLADFPQISKKQITDMFADMERRFTEAGSTLHAVHQMRRDVAVNMGDRATADAAHDRFLATNKDHLSNCAACVADSNVEYFLFRGDDAESLKAARSVLQGRLSCAEVPHRTYAVVLLPMFRQGKVAEAMETLVMGYRMISDNAKFVRHWGMGLLLLGLTDNLAQGVKLVERHLGDAMATPSLGWQFEFFRATRFLLNRLQDKRQQVVSMRLPKEFPNHRTDGRYAVAELREWFDAKLNDLATRFDTRNGNDHFRRRIAELERLKSQVKAHPISTKR